MTKIVIIEDDPLLINMYQTKFTIEGYDVIVAGDGEDGLQKVLQNKPDLLILDLMMPKLDGMDLVKKLRELPEFNSLPILMFSNMQQADLSKQALELGVREFLLKSEFTPSQIVDKIKQYVQ